MAVADSPPPLALREVVKEFRLGQQRVRALAGVDLDVAGGEFLVVMGPSGSGKSTLLNLIGGLDRPTGGHILVDEDDLASLDEIDLATYRQQMVGFIFQSFNLIATMTARQNVEFPMVFAGRPPRERRERAESLLRQLGLGERTSHRPVELSGGEQQRVAVARAMANAPQMVLCDEPTGNLDTHTGREIMELLAAVNRTGRTVIVVTHDARLTGYADRIVHMEDGRILREETGQRIVTTEQ